MLTINKSTAQIKNINLRLEMHGDETKAACDIKLIIHVTKGAKELLGSLSIGQLSLWDKSGDAQLQELSMACRHAIEQVHVTMTHSNQALTLADTKMDKIALSALDDTGIEISCTIKSLVSNTQVTKLIDLWKGGSVSIEAKEVGQVEIAA